MNDSLKHYGVLGMKWGRSRGRQSTSTSVRKKSKKTGEEQELDETNKKIKSERRMTNKKRRTLSDEDLKIKIGRLELEKKLKELTQQDIDKGKSPVTKLLIDIGESSLRAAGTAVGTYAVKAILDGKFDRKEAASFIKPKK